MVAVDRPPADPAVDGAARAAAQLGVDDPAAAGAGDFRPGPDRPARRPGATALAAVVVAFLSASQDIVIDAYRIELLRPEEQGAGAAATQWGYRFGMLASGAGALYAASYGGWRFAYAVMAALMGVGMVTVWLTPEPGGMAPPERCPAPPRWSGSGVAKRAVVAPFLDLFARNGAAQFVAIGVFIVLYKFGDALAGSMSNPLYVALGFTKVEVATIAKVYGVIATLVGVALGGVLVARIGVFRALLICGGLQALSNLMYAVQVWAGHDVAMLAVTIGAENVTGGMASAAFVAYLSRPVQPRVHRDPIRAAVVAGDGRAQRARRLGRRARRAARLDPVFRGRHAVLRAEPRAPYLAHAPSAGGSSGEPSPSLDALDLWPDLLEDLAAKLLLCRVAGEVVRVQRLADGDLRLAKAVERVGLAHRAKLCLERLDLALEVIGEILANSVELPEPAQLALQHRSPGVPVRAFARARADRSNGYVALPCLGQA